MREITETYDVCVCGGGLAGVCAAIAAARHGARTVLIQDRPVLGGNSSSEIRVTPHGAAAFHAYARETGILSELLIEERARNHEQIFENGWTNSVYDLVLYDAVMAEPNLTLRLNTGIVGVHTEGRRLAAVQARIAGAETLVTIIAQTFVDCTGDGLVAAEAGCEWRMGCEGRDEFDEPHAPEQASPHTMGNSIHFRTRDTGREAPFALPEWAQRYEDASFFYAQGRRPDDVRGGFWWIEISVPWHTIHDAEDIRHELTRHALGVWDWMKNRDPVMREKTRTYALDWIGQVPGKRESRRIMGRYLMTEHDPQGRTVFPDEVAFGGWFVDLHTLGGLLAPTSEPASAEGYKPDSEYAIRSYVGPYGIPLRSLIAKDLDNLLLAGRNISVTHAALGTVRVQATTALMGQAVGTAAAVALRRGLAVPEVPAQAMVDVQQALLRDGCFLPNSRNQDPRDLARRATATASSTARVHGAGPDSRGAHDGLASWADQDRRPRSEALTHRRGQWIAVATPRLDLIGVCLSNTSGAEQTVEARLVAVEHIWDYRAGGSATIATTTLRVPPGERMWVDWELGLDLAPGQYVRLDLLPNPALVWHVAGTVLPGHVSAFEMGRDKMRRFADGVTQSFRVAPPQPCFGPENLLSGVTRPHRFTNLWRSDPAEPLPQWVELAWKQPQMIAQVELTFPGHLLREYHAYQPFYRDPQCPRDYTVSALVDGSWRELVDVRDNYQRRRVHRLAKAVRAEQLRVTVKATNGDPSAAIYEVRCYAE